ncbi:MAG: hypothetical protein JWM68_2469, partial [Verrucomicrobiales bacterium]|nr:hypothetical protein [Verrucomicrobiales bacterium]
MRLFRPFIFFCVLMTTVASFAASREETHAFKSATKVFADHIFYLAEGDFGAFAEKFPASEHRSEAILFQARARYQQTNYAGTIDVLTKELAQAGALLDQYHFWIAESHFAAGDYMPAAKSYRELLSSLQQSPLRLQAAYNEALSFSKLKDWPRVTELLGKTDGAFQVASKSQPESDFTVNGNLLLGEALAAKGELSQAESVLTNLGQRHLNSLNQWRREFLSTRIFLAQSRLDGALQNSTNLMQLASSVGDRTVVGESIGLQAEIFERLNRLPEAVECYEKTLGEGFSTEMRRRSLSRSIELTLQQGKIGEAIRKLKSFIEQNLRDPAVDIALLSLGELQLKEYFNRSEGTTNNSTALVTQTNLLQEAMINFVAIQTNFPQSEFLGKVSLDVGWCLWIQGQTDEAEKSFGEAAKVLPVSGDKAIAIFKRADCQFKRKDYTSAAANYDILIQNFGSIEPVKSVLLDQALYQSVRAGIALTNQPMSEQAAKKILDLYPNSFFADRSLLLFGQGLNRQGKPSEARTAFAQFVTRFPNSTLRPEAELAIARTYVQEKEWSKAIKHLETWESKFTNHVLIADAEFSRAVAYAQSGEATNALVLLTNIVARFPSNNLAARAESWIGDYYFNAEEYPKAEAHYQEVLKHNPTQELSDQAYLMAGRSAFERQGYEEARKSYFEPLINNTNTSSTVLAEAFFALGDTIFARFL